jgi:hypothetical protein
VAFHAAPLHRIEDGINAHAAAALLVRRGEMRARH